MPDERIEIEKLSPSDETTLVRPGYPRTTGLPDAYGYGYGAPADGIRLRELWRIIRKRKWLIVVIVVIVTTLVTIQTYRTKSTYEASATVEIEKNSATLVKSGDVILQTDIYDISAMKTNIFKLKSEPLLEEVIVKLKLDRNPRFRDVSKKNSLWEALKTIGRKVTRTRTSTQEPTAEADTRAPHTEGDLTPSPAESARLAPFLGVLRGNLDVEQVRDTQLLTVSFTHTDPIIAADVANGVAKFFIDSSFQNKTEKFTSTSEWLERTTRELKARVEQAEQELANYTRENNIFSNEDKESLPASKLSRLHEQSLRAETDRLLKHSLYEEVKAGRVAQLPEAFADPKAAAQQTKIDELTITAAQLDLDYGSENPKVIEVRQQITAIEKQINTSRTALEEKLRAEYERSVRDEQSLKAALERAKAEAVQQNQAAIQFNILKQSVDTAKSLYTDFLQKTNQAKIQVAEQHSNMRVIQPAKVPTSPVGPKRFQMIVIGLFVSLTLGLGLVFFLEYLDNTIKTVEDVSRYAQLPALAVIPSISRVTPRGLLAKKKDRGKIAGNGSSESDNGYPLKPTQLMTLNSRSSAAEAYRALRTSVLLSAAGRPPKTILITSGQAAEGKTTTVVNTAISLAQLGASVLIIDCDLRKPATHKIFDVDHMRGLSTYISRDVEIDELIHKLPIANLSLLPCGPIPPNPAELISSDKMKSLLNLLASRYDHILIDSPPLMHVTDSVILSTMVDGVILVVHGGKSTREVARRARQELESVGAKIFGVVLNNVDLRRHGYDDYYNYYRSYSDYGQERSDSAGDRL